VQRRSALQQPIQEFLPLSHRYLLIHRTSGIKATREQVNLACLGNLRSLDDFPYHVRDDVDRNADVGSDEVSSIPVSAEENPKAGEDGDDAAADGADVGGEGLKTSLHRESVAIDVLGLAGVVVADIADTEGHPCEETGDSTKVEQPGKGLRCTTRAQREIGEGTKGKGSEDGPVRYTLAVDLGEELRHLAICGESDEHARTDVAVAVTG
jgi:hypothetical protein